MRDPLYNPYMLQERELRPITKVMKYRSDHWLSPRFMKELGQAVDTIPANARVTVEGAYIRADKPWDTTHEFAYNTIIPHLDGMLRSRGNLVQHMVFIDEYTAPPTYPDEEYLDNILFPPAHALHESSYVEQAQHLFQKIETTGNIFTRNNETRLGKRDQTPQPLLKTRSGRYSGLIMDAAFQWSKGPGYHFVIDTTEHLDQHRQMKTIFAHANESQQPYHFHYIFLRGTTLSQVVQTTIGPVTHANHTLQ